ncbi:MAG TPA: hypothetical protein PK349_11880 [Candidatus Hydrogenedentes bacterium]|nr:hypothetical protein [Candidatus Hydrogenedentota bacterium]
MVFLALFGMAATAVGQTSVPACEVTVSPEGTVNKGDIVTIHYAFPGASADGKNWMILPPAWPEVTGLEFTGWEQVISSEAPSKTITWTAKARVTGPGFFTIPSLNFRVYPEAALPAGPVSLAGEQATVVETPSVTIHARDPRKVLFAGILAAIAFTLVVGTAAYGISRKRGRPGNEREEASSVQDRWHRARRLRLDGDAYGALKELLALCGELEGPKELINELDAAARDAGFRNRIPDPDTFESLFRRVEKVLRERTAGAGPALKPTGKPE